MVTQFPSKSDIIDAMKNQVCYRSHELTGGKVIQNGARVVCYTGGFASVFPFITANGDKIVVRCWSADIGDAQKRMLSISKYLAQLNSSYFIKFKYYNSALLINGILQPIITMDWVEHPTLKEFINHKIDDKSSILKLAEKFKAMVYFLHQNGIAHGDLSHGNIKVKDDGNLLVIDYDSMYIKDLNGMPDIVKGQPGYQHPKRHCNLYGNSKLDYFSELVIYLSFLVYAEYPYLWQEYYDTEDLLFSRQDYESPNSSRLIRFLEKSTNLDIADLTGKLIEFLKYDDISALKPLEDVFKHRFEIIANQIIDKF
jgi:serine/threonine protein kinase